jgi:transcriptional antiterminator NusG
MIFGIRTTIGQEKTVAGALQTKLRKGGQNIAAIAMIDGLKGYLIVEAATEEDLRKLVYKAPHVRGVVSGAMGIGEFTHFFETKPMTTGIERGAIVEITSGAFKGEKARVLRVDEGKEKITVEIIEAAVPIPLTIEASSVRIIQKAGE